MLSHLFGHIAKRCKVKIVCSHCRNRHSTILCPKLEEIKKVEENSVQSSVNIEQSLSNHNFPEVLLQTLVVELIADNKSRRTRLVLDSGSHKSYITSSLAEEMGYPMLREQQLIHSLFGGTVTDPITHRCYKVRMRSLTENCSCNFEVLEQPIICSNIPSIRPGPWLAELKKMDIVVTDIEEGPIEIRVGADIMGKLLTGQQKYLSYGLSAIHTLLGWTLMGKTNSTDAIGNSLNMIVNSMLCNDISISNLWRLDVLGIQDPQENKKEEENGKLVMEHFLSTVKRRKDGRYEVDMPWIEDHPPLPTNFHLAKGRLDNVMKKLKSGNLYEKYNSIFEEWKVEEIIEEFSVETTDITGYFLPHHPVIKPLSSTTKIRPVFDATAHERQQPSINQCLEKGVNLTDQIPSMLFRFRCKKFGVIADIRKAFLQMGLNPRDREFLWYDIESKNLRIFRHARVVFGITCSPFLLGAVIDYHLQNLLFDESSLFSKTVIQQLRKSFYVDNIVTSVDTQENLDTFIEESNKILLDGKFELRGWEYSLSENSATFIDKLSPLLGLVWNRNSDALQLSTEGLTSISIEKVTKRTILSAAHKLIDPIGFTSHVALFPKILLQGTWALKLGWDTEVDEKIKTDFKNWFEELKYLAQVQVPRWFFNSLNRQNSSLHIFCDASKHAYATAIFLRSESNVGTFITLVQAKTRVASLNKLTIPRLELMAATIGPRLSRGVREEIGSDIKTYFWTDSSTVLSWIKREDQWKPFVWNRVEEIRKYSDKNDWFHVNGENNPADLPSRGCFGKKLADERWWEGPAWLRTL